MRRHLLTLLSTFLTFSAFAEDAGPIAESYRRTVTKLEVLAGLPRTTKRADARRQAEEAATRRLKSRDEALDKAVADVAREIGEEKFSKTPKIVLVADIHSNEKDGKVINGLIADSASKHVVALEGLSLGWKNGPVTVEMANGRKYDIPTGGRVSGIELAPYLAIQGLGQVRTMLRGDAKANASGRKLLLQALVMGYGDEVLEATKKDPDLLKAMAPVLDHLKRSDLKTIDLALEKTEKNSPPLAAWEELATVTWARQCLADHRKSVLSDELQRVAKSVIEKPTDPGPRTALHVLTSFDTRNYTWTQVVTALYRNVLEEDEPLYVVMGAAHVPTMEKYLKQVLGPKGVTIETRLEKPHLDELKAIAKFNEDILEKELAKFPE